LDNDLYQLSFVLLEVLWKKSFGTLSCCLEAPYNDKLQTFENGIGHGSAATNILVSQDVVSERGNAVD
jgi:hypothetical protein